MMMKKIFPGLLFSLLIVFSSGRYPYWDRFGGIALYTVRAEMNADPKGTLQKVADIGYEYIEAAGYDDGKFYGMAPTEFKEYLEQVGLEPLSTHQGGMTYENADQMIADVKAAGFQYLVIPVPPLGMASFDSKTRTMTMKDDIESVVKFLNSVGKKCKEAGLQLLYHNHNFEFKKNSKGIVPLSYFLENTDPEFVNFQMDLYWVTNAGVDPIEFFKKYPGRFKIWHVKDMDEEGQFAPVGSGTIDFKRILDQKELSGMQYYFVEQDRTYDIKPLEAIKISHEGLSKFGFK